VDTLNGAGQVAAELISMLAALVLAGAATTSPSP
jgi:hypothetical protein